MDVMEGLGQFEIWKTIFFIIIISICFVVSIFLIFYYNNKHYVSTKGIIVSNNDSSFTQNLTYTVNDKIYTQLIPATTKTKKSSISVFNSHSTTTYRDYAYPNGEYTVFYASNNPNDYNINVNPSTIVKFVSAGLFLFGVLATIFYFFLKSHPNAAGIFGGLDVANSILHR